MKTEAVDLIPAKEPSPYTDNRMRRSVYAQHIMLKNAHKWSIEMIEKQDQWIKERSKQWIKERSKWSKLKRILRIRK